MKHQTCCFTGHRIIPQAQYPALKKRLASEIVHLIHQGVIYFGAGGALGFDTLAALTVLELKAEYPQMITPCGRALRKAPLRQAVCTS